MKGKQTWKNETQKERNTPGNATKEEKTNLLLFLLFCVVGSSLGKTLPGNKGKKHYETRVYVVTCSWEDKQQEQQQ